MLLNISTKIKKYTNKYLSAHIRKGHQKKSSPIENIPSHKSISTTFVFLWQTAAPLRQYFVIYVRFRLCYRFNSLKHSVTYLYHLV
jgi:phosphoglycerate-specific signal transduction histidine kinase